eukprot:evm.model.scf_3141.1 EVM.evm.TU.scf_3141.1   scf_3141:6100-10850(+)
MRATTVGLCLLLWAAAVAQGEGSDAVAAPAKLGTEVMGRVVGYGEVREEWRGEVIQLSWAPRAYLLKGFLTEEECDHLIALGSPKLTKSTVVDNESGKSIPSQVRTSKGTFLNTAQDEVVDRIERRVAQVTMIPVEHQEGMQILKYVNGEKYEPHFDYFHDVVNQKPESGGQRIMTMLMYLSTVPEGGETVFPNAVKSEHVGGPEWSDCAKRGLAVKAKKGDAIMFYGLKPDGSEDQTSLHGSCPTTKGEKWSATKWIHVLPFNRNNLYQRAKWGDCVDTEDQCEEWASTGECEKNSAYMKVHCRRACSLCEPAKENVATT